MSAAHEKYHHGQSPAAWAGVIVSGIGFLIGTVAFLIGPNWPLVWVAAVFVLVGPIVGGVMRRIGLGQD